MGTFVYLNDKFGFKICLLLPNIIVQQVWNILFSIMILPADSWLALFDYFIFIDANLI